MFLIAGPLLDKAWWILENRHKAPLAQAIKIAEKEIQKNPNSFLAWRILTEAYLEMGDQQKSKKEKLAYYRKGLNAARVLKRIAPNKPDGYFWEGANLGRIGQTKGVLKSAAIASEVKKDFLTALEKDPLYLPALEGLGVFYYELPSFMGGDLKKSEKYLRKAIRVNPRYTLAWLDLAKTLYKQKRYCEAKKALLKVINCKNPLHPGDYFMDDLPEAKKLLKKVSKKCPE